MSRFVISNLKAGPTDLRDQLPASGFTSDMRAGPDSQNYFYAQLDQSLKYRFDAEFDTARCQPEHLGNDAIGSFLWVTEIVFRANTPDEQPHYGMRGFAIDLAYVIDPSYASDSTFDPSKVVNVAVAEIDDVAEQHINDVATELASPDTEQAVMLTKPEPGPAGRQNVTDTPDVPEGVSYGPESERQNGIRGSASPHDHAPRLDAISRRPLSLAPAAAQLAPRTHHQPLLSMEFAVPVRRPSRATWVVAAVIIVGLVAGVIALWSRTTPAEPDPNTPAVETSSAAATIPGGDRERAKKRLNELLPQGYPTGACAPDDMDPSGAPAVTCGPNIDPDGPVSATYTLQHDQDALAEAFEKVTATSAQMNCPGNIQSPGPWRHNATPEKIAGMLFCGVQNGRPTVAWTNDADRLLNVVQSGPQGPTQEQLYAWWSTHS